MGQPLTPATKALSAALRIAAPTYIDIHENHPHSGIKHPDDYDRLAESTVAALDGVIVPVIWPWPGNTRLPWQVWNEVPHRDCMTIYDPDGFRDGKPTIVTWDEFERARMVCTMVFRSGVQRVVPHG